MLTYRPPCLTPQFLPINLPFHQIVLFAHFQDYGTRCIHVFEENHSSNNIYPIFNNMLQSCDRKSFNDAARERSSLRSQNPFAEFRPPLTQNSGYPLLVVKAKRCFSELLSNTIVE